MLSAVWSCIQSFIFFDAGLYRVLRPLGPLDSDAEVDGGVLETLLFQNLRAVNDSLHFNYDLYFWRTASGLEVDFILYGAKGLHAIEVKRSRSISKKDLTALESFKKEYPEATCWMVFGGEHRHYFGSITAVPFAEFLFSLPEILNGPLEAQSHPFRGG